MTESIESILGFWFGASVDDAEVAQEKGRMWWSKNEAVDEEIRRRFEACTAAALHGALDEWAATPRGVLALVLLTDQFPRNMYRGQPASFAFDAIALRWALHGLERGMDSLLRPIERVFLYLPFEHSESIADQRRSVLLYEQLLRDVPPQHESTFSGFGQFAIRHRDIIARFGRFPHRNAILGRASTGKEIAFLQTPGSSF